MSGELLLKVQLMKIIMLIDDIRELGNELDDQLVEKTPTEGHLNDFNNALNRAYQAMVRAHYELSTVADNDRIDELNGLTVMD